ncbi:MAG: divalent metal cation transporter [Candidatus Eremiobacteraeota bacterium]|nr:divalent metal cation transporter [Candidatus Eremiobacteraeota bacterium]
MSTSSEGPLRKAGWAYWSSVLGPGLITGASDDDPSGISTYSVAGASAGLSMLWIVLVTTPMMAVIQGMCSRIGMVTGVGLATNMRKHLPAWMLYPLSLSVIVANIINAGADLEGMGSSARLVTSLPEWFWVIVFGVVLVVLQVFFSYRALFNVVKWLTLSLFAYIITAFIVHPHWGDVLKHLVTPELHFNAAWLTTLMAVLGTTITPYLFFWQACLMVEEEKSIGRNTALSRRGATEQEIKDSHIDCNVGMIFSNIVAFFIIVTTAATLAASGHSNIQTAQDAALALRPLAGRFAYLLFSLGMVGTGLLAIPALVASSAYVAAETLQWKHGLSLNLQKAPGFYGTLIVGMIVAVAMDFLHVNVISALLWSAVINGIVAVPLLAVIVWFAGSKKLMSKWRSSLLARIWGWATVAVMGVAAISIFVFWGKS